MQAKVILEIKTKSS